MGEQRPDRKTSAGGTDPRFASAPVVFVTVLAAVAAGAAGVFLSGTTAYVAIGLVAVFAAVLAGVTARGSDDGRRIQRLLKLAEEGGSSERRVPVGYPGEWGTLYLRTSALAEEARTAKAALNELESYRRHGEIAVSALRSGKDPLTEIPELRVGPLRGILEAAKNGALADSAVGRIPLGEEDLIGLGDATLPEAWPNGAPPAPAAGPAISAEVRRSLDEFVRELGELHEALSGNGPRTPGDAGAVRTPAQLLDAVVHTAADGIEDLAAGLMRANELASVAERVTNRATLLALNAALEATRSGSEAFASIAEETRRLAEFAREATDTISRLASEIEYKVGETITAIHSTSEDAKFSLAQFSGAAAGGVPIPRPARAQVESLLRRATTLKRNLESPAPVQSVVENGSPSADDSSTEGIILIEGLDSGARLDR